MNMRSSVLPSLLLAFICSYETAVAQVPPEIAEKLREIGRVINPPATQALYAGRVVEAEPYAGVKVERDISYGDAPRNQLDVFVPAGESGKPRPVLIFVHGGAFVAGNRRLSPTSSFYDNVMLWAVRNGMIGVNISYRLAPGSPWPAGPEDVGLAVKWVHEQIGARGGDVKRMFLFGHSSGATHVASYVSHPEFQKVAGTGLAGALMLSGIYEVTADLVGGSPSYPGYYGKDASRYSERSSIAGLLKTSVPLWIGYAENDTPAFEAQSVKANEALCAAKKCPAFIKFSGHSHMSEAYSIHTDDNSVGRALLEFIIKTPSR